MGILLIIFSVLVFLSGLYLTLTKKRDFAQVLLWKNDVKKMKKEDIKLAGKITMLVSLSILIAGILAFFLEDSFIPIIVLLVTAIIFILIGIKLFK